MAVFVNDTFSGESSNVALTSHTGETGASWSTISGLLSLSISSGNANVYVPASGSHGNYANGSPASAEYDIEADLSGGNLSRPSICARVNTSEETFYMARADTDDDIVLYKVVNGSFTLLASKTDGAASSGTMKLEVRDSLKTVYYDEEEACSSANNDISSAGKAGMRFVGGTTASRIDNFTATDAAAVTNRLTNYYYTHLMQGGL